MTSKASVLKITLYPGEPKAFLNDPDSGVWTELDRRMLRAQAVARAKVRVRTGKLLSTIRKNRVTFRGLPAVELAAGGGGVKYAGYENDGTEPHIIRARRKKSLRFMVGGRVVFAKAVHHPGTRGSHFLYPDALNAAGGF